MLPEINDAYVRRISIAQRAVLVEHIDGAVPLDRRDRFHTQTVTTLMTMKLLRDEKSGGVDYVCAIRPRATMLTIRGREALAKVLAEYADALSRVMELADAEIRPIQMLQRLKAMRVATRWTVPPEEPEEADSASRRAKNLPNRPFAAPHFRGHRGDSTGCVSLRPGAILPLIGGPNDRPSYRQRSR
jgi:hypothetical protein